jgi:hypothetical protein
MDPVDTTQVQTEETLEDRCATIVSEKQKKAENKIKKLIIEIVEERYNRYFPHGVLELANGIFYKAFPDIIKKYFTEEFGEFLGEETDKVFEYFGRNMVYFINYIGLENINKVKQELPKFIDSQFNDSNLWLELTFEPLYNYLLEHNGILPPSLTQVQEEPEGNPVE